MHLLSLIPINIVTKWSVFKHLHQIKAQKLDQLIGPHSSLESLKTVVTIPENLPLSSTRRKIRQSIVIHCPSYTRLGDRFREYVRDAERNDKDASKPVARRLNLPNHSKQRMAVCGLSLRLGSSECCKTLEQKFSSKSAPLIPKV